MLSSWLALAIAQTPTSTAAIDSEPELEVLGFHFHGFVSQGAFKSTSNNYLGESNRGSFAFTEVGFNVTRSVTEDLTAGLQFFARFLGSTGSFSAKFDWFYLDYRWSDRLGIRAGRVKLPFGLYNEFSDIDSARVPILLPQGVYPITNRDYLLAQTGVDIYGTIPISVAGDLAYRLYGGTILFDDFGPGEEPDPNAPVRAENLKTRYIFGGRLLWETPLEGLRFAGSVQALRIDFDVVVNPVLSMPLQEAGLLDPSFSGLFDAALAGVLWIASVEYIAGDFSFASEYSRWIVDLKSRQPVIIPEMRLEREQFYAMTDYRVADWFHPGIYYSLLFPNVDMRSGRANVQHDVALTLRFDINPYWLIKIEGHYMSGTAYLRPNLNDFRPANTLDREWGFFLAKTTLSF